MLAELYMIWIELLRRATSRADHAASTSPFVPFAGNHLNSFKQDALSRR